MNLSNNAKATLLLTSYFSKPSQGSVKPLSNSEWGRFALWLKEKSLSPEHLLSKDAGKILINWTDSNITLDRLLSLLDRGHSLAFATEKWARAGIWILTRSDAEYPRRLKDKLKTNSPPIIFGCGNKRLLNEGGIAVVGSRKAPSCDLTFTENFGTKAALSNITIISGASKGVDEAAMIGALNVGGKVIGVLSEDLLGAATSKKWRQGLMAGNALLISPYYPEAGFNAGHAMGRNKYIYCLSDTSLVIHSGKTGGTISGAEENLKNNWVPLWVKTTNDENSANVQLIEKGGYGIGEDLHKLDITTMFLLNSNNVNSIKKEQSDFFSAPINSVAPDIDQLEKGFLEKNQDVKNDKRKYLSKSSAAVTVDFYQIFIDELYRLSEIPITLKELVEATGLHSSQINEWLRRAIDERVVKKLHDPVRYQRLGINDNETLIGKDTSEM